MTPELVSQLAVGAVMGLLYWSLNRNVALLDGHIRSMVAKVDELHKTETGLQLKVAELTVRVQHTEAMLARIEIDLERLREVRG